MNVWALRASFFLNNKNIVCECVCIVDIINLHSYILIRPRKLIRHLFVNVRENRWCVVLHGGWFWCCFVYLYSLHRVFIERSWSYTTLFLYAYINTLIYLNIELFRFSWCKLYVELYLRKIVIDVCNRDIIYYYLYIDRYMFVYEY